MDWAMSGGPRTPRWAAKSPSICCWTARGTRCGGTIPPGGVDRAQLNHPHVLLRVYDFGEDQDRCYLFMELVDNRSLRAALTERGGPLEGLRRYLDRSGAACPASAKAGGIEWS